MIFIWLGYLWFGINGAGFMGVAWLLVIYGIDRASVRWSEKRWASYPGRYVPPPP